MVYIRQKDIAGFKMNINSVDDITVHGFKTDKHMIDKLVSLDEGKSLVSQCTLSVKDHPFLSDHAIDGVPYHPGVMAMEMCAENSLLLVPDHCIAGFEDVTFGLPVKIMKGAMTVRVEAELVKSEGDLKWIHCRLVSD